MVALRDLHRKLHNRDNSDLTKREHSPDDYNVDGNDTGKKTDSKQIEFNKAENENQQIEKKPLVSESKEENRIHEIPLQDSEEGFFVKNKIRLFVGTMGTLLILILGAVFYVKFKQSSFKQENVLIEFQGVKETRSGDQLAQRLIVENNNRTSLEDTKIKIIFPEELIPVYSSFMEQGPSGSFYINTGNLFGFEKKEYELQFKVNSSFDSQFYLNTEFNYMPDNFSSNFVKENSFLYDIKGSVVSFSLVSQQEAANGETLKFIGILNNNNNFEMDNLILEIEKGTAFQFEESGLEKIEGSENRFRISKLGVGEKRAIDILGNFNGEINSIQKLSGKIGLLGENNNFLEITSAEESVKIIPSRITMDQEVVSGIKLNNQTVGIGQSLVYRLTFKNNSSSPLSDLILTEKLEGALIDEASFKMKNGYYNANTKEIIWKASDVASLKILNPGESGSVEFGFRVRDDLFPEEGKNQTIETQAKISSLNIDTNLLKNKEISSEKEIVKIKTNLEILTSADYDNTIFKNKGPLPVVSGEETTFTFKVELKNNFNKVRSPKILVKLPSGIIWKDNYRRSSGEVNFNSRTNELTWNFSSLNSGVGYNQPTEELLFQIGIIPQNGHSGNNLNLINSVVLNGYEEFVEENIFVETREFKVDNVNDYDFQY